MSAGRARTTRDAWGIPHVTGDSLLAVVREQGRVTAVDRAEQLDLERRRGDGTLGELGDLAGPGAAEWDVLAQRVRLPGLARRAHATLGPEARAMVEAYVDGVNAALPAGLARWQPWTPLAVFAVQHLLFGAFPNKLWRRHLGGFLDEPELALLRTEGLPGGSNAFAVAGSLTTTGLPVVAGDPHRVIESPGIYAQVRLTCTDPDDLFDVVGLTFVGVPGVQHFAHAGTVAWGITNAVADTEDLSGPHDEGAGPRTPPDVLGDLGLDVLPRLLRARTTADVATAFGDHWVAPVNNLVVADTAGDVRLEVVGRVPLRGEDGDWTGWVEDLPSLTGDLVVTANDRVADAWSRIGEDFAPPFRARRLRGLLEELTQDGPATPAQLATVLADVRQTAGTALLEAVAELRGLSASATRLQRRLAAWDREMRADSVDAALFAAVREAVVEGLYDAPRLRGADVSPHGQLFGPWFDLRARLRLCLPAILAAEKPFGVDPGAVVTAAVEQVAARPDPPPWGERHVLLGTTVPLGGDDDCVLAHRAVGGTGPTVHGPVARYVWDLTGDSRWVVPLGASGDPASPHHHDQLAVWASGGTIGVPR